MAVFEGSGLTARERRQRKKAAEALRREQVREVLEHCVKCARKLEDEQMYFLSYSDKRACRPCMDKHLLWGYGARSVADEKDGQSVVLRFNP